MKKFALSLFVIAASGGYVWEQSWATPADDLLGSVLPTGVAQTDSTQRRVPSEPAEPTPLPRSVPLLMHQSVESRGAGELIAGASPSAQEPVKTLAEPPTRASMLADTPRESALHAPVRRRAALVDVPLPRPRPAFFYATPAHITRVALTIAAGANYADGAHTGPAVNAYYGFVQVQAMVQGGRLVGIKILKYPSHRQTSVSINRRALPMLRDEVISAQTADVDIVSGATLTSEAFIRSLGAALRSQTTS